MERIQFINHKGKKILYFDFSSCRPDEANKVVEDAMAFVKKQPQKSLYTLTNVSGIRFDTNIGDKFKDFAAHNKPYVIAGAVVGISGLLKVLYTAITKFTGRNLPAFDTVEQAKDWLAQQ